MTRWKFRKENERGIWIKSQDGNKLVKARDIELISDSESIITALDIGELTVCFAS
jgi:hypothetical protein